MPKLQELVHMALSYYIDAVASVTLSQPVTRFEVAPHTCITAGTTLSRHAPYIVRPAACVDTRTRHPAARSCMAHWPPAK